MVHWNRSGHRHEAVCSFARGFNIGPPGSTWYTGTDQDMKLYVVLQGSSNRVDQVHAPYVCVSSNRDLLYSVVEACDTVCMACVYVCVCACVHDMSV